MNAETRAIVDAVIEALEIPYAATVRGDETRKEILEKRVRDVLVLMHGLAGPDPDPEWRLAYLRERLAEHAAIGYVTTDQAHERVRQGASWPEAVAMPEPAVTP